MKYMVSTSANIMQPMINIQSVPKSHINMVTALANLNAESLTLKEAKASP